MRFSSRADQSGLRRPLDALLRASPRPVFRWTSAHEVWVALRSLVLRGEPTAISRGSCPLVVSSNISPAPTTARLETVERNFRAFVPLLKLWHGSRLLPRKPSPCSRELFPFQGFLPARADFPAIPASVFTRPRTPSSHALVRNDCAQPQQTRFRVWRANRLAFPLSRSAALHKVLRLFMPSDQSEPSSGCSRTPQCPNLTPVSRVASALRRLQRATADSNFRFAS